MYILIADFEVTLLQVIWFIIIKIPLTIIYQFSVLLQSKISTVTFSSNHIECNIRPSVWKITCGNCCVADSYVATSLLYSARSDGQLLTCMDFDSQFLTALSAGLDITAPSGLQYSILTSLTLSQVMEKARAYEFVLSKRVAMADIQAVELSLEAQWLTEFSGQRFSYHVYDKLTTTSKCNFILPLYMSHNDVYVTLFRLQKLWTSRSLCKRSTLIKTGKTVLKLPVWSLLHVYTSLCLWFRVLEISPLNLHINPPSVCLAGVWFQGDHLEGAVLRREPTRPAGQSYRRGSRSGRYCCSPGHSTGVCLCADRDVWCIYLYWLHGPDLQLRLQVWGEHDVRGQGRCLHAICQYHTGCMALWKMWVLFIFHQINK